VSKIQLKITCIKKATAHAPYEAYFGLKTLRSPWRNYLRWLLQKIEDDETLLGRVWLSDVIDFYMNEHVNNKHGIFWKTSKPDEV
jgi:hypothetical protein